MAMDSNPYAPPRARVADPEPGAHGLKKRSVLMMIVFMIITLGIYYPVWWFRRRPGLNRLNSPRKLSVWVLVLLAALFAFQFLLGIVEGAAPEEQPLGPEARLVISLIQMAVSFYLLFQTFKIKAMIEDHATPAPGSEPMFAFEHVKLSGVMTFFFSVFYLQWAINRYVVGK